jgi:hypothetical protein
MPEAPEPGKPNSVSLLCLRPPGSVEKEVAALQHRLYIRLGLVSGLCLPPLIPLLFFLKTPAVKRPPPQTLGDMGKQGLSLRTRGYGLAENCLFWDLEAPRRFASWRRALLAGLSVPDKAMTTTARPLFPPRAGFFLACREESPRLPAWPSAAGELSGLVGPPPVISFPAAALALLEIRLLTDSSRWYQAVVWEEKTVLAFKTKPRSSH